MWPMGFQCALALTFDFDAESLWLADDPQNENRPGILSRGRYAARVAVPWLIELLGSHQMRATFFVPGVVAERHPGAVRQLAKAGHELAVHGWEHLAPRRQTPAEEEAHLLQARTLLQTFSPGINGYRAPDWDISPHTISLLEKHGFSYSSNLMDDIRPYLHPGTSIVELPVHWALDDAAHFLFDSGTWQKKISTPAEVRAIWDAEFEMILERQGAFILTLHPQVIGRPHRMKMLDEFIRFVRSHPGAWIATAGEIARQARLALEP